jgi:hypothetical protein
MPVKLDAKDYGIIAVGAAFIGLIVLVARQRTSTGQPKYDADEAVMAGLAVKVVDSLDTGDHYFHPAYCVPGQTQIFTPHKYPAVSGANVSTLIHHGMDRLCVPAPQDADWIERPPGEVMF